MTTQGQVHSLTFVQGHSDSTFSNFFSSETAWPMWGMKIVKMFQVTWPCPDMVKNFKNFLLWNQEADDFETWYTASGTGVLPFFQMMTLGWPIPFLWRGQICFLMLLHGESLIYRIHFMYFQVCSNSAYPQHSGERYRIIGPLVIFFSSKTHQEACQSMVQKWYILSTCNN